jgi:hypothetical protein
MQSSNNISRGLVPTPHRDKYLEEGQATIYWSLIVCRLARDQPAGYGRIEYYRFTSHPLLLPILINRQRRSQQRILNGTVS